MLAGKPNRVMIRLFRPDPNGWSHTLISESEQDTDDFKHVFTINAIDPDLKCNVTYLRLEPFDRTSQVLDYYMMSIANQKIVNTIQPLTFKDSSILYVKDEE